MREEVPPCGKGQPDPDEPANDWPWTAGVWTYGFVHRTFHSPEDRFDWYRYDPAWTGTHWFWSSDLDPSNQKVVWTVYTLDFRQLIRGESYRQGDLGVYLEKGKEYFLSVENADGRIGCRVDNLEP